MKIGVMLLSGPYQTEDADTALRFVEAALARGHEVVGVFLFMDGLLMLNGKISTPGERNLPKQLEALAARVPVKGCGTCARFKGVTKADLIANTELTGLPDLLEMLDLCDRFVTFGG